MSLTCSTEDVLSIDKTQWFVPCSSSPRYSFSFFQCHAHLHRTSTTHTNHRMTRKGCNCHYQGPIKLYTLHNFQKGRKRVHWLLKILKSQLQNHSVELFSQLLFGEERTIFRHIVLTLYLFFPITSVARKVAMAILTPNSNSSI